MADDANSEPTKSGTISQVYLKKDNTYYDVCDTKSRTDMANLLDKIYPIGSIYMSMVDVSPQDFIGGSWTRIENSFLIAASNPSAQNKKYVVQTEEPFDIEGNADGTVILNTSQIPLKDHRHEMIHSHDINIAHTHSLNNHTHDIEAHNHGMVHKHRFEAYKNDPQLNGIHRIGASQEAAGNPGLVGDGWAGGRVIVGHIQDHFDYNGSIITTVPYNKDNMWEQKSTTDNNTKALKTKGPNSTDTGGVKPSPNFSTGNISTNYTKGVDNINNINQTIEAVNIMPPYIAVYMWRRTA